MKCIHVCLIMQIMDEEKLGWQIQIGYKACVTWLFLSVFHFFVVYKA